MSEFMMLSSKNVFDDHLTFEAPRYLLATDFTVEDRRTNVAAGDVLLTIVGTIGRAAVVPTNTPKFTLQRSVAVIRPDSSVIDSRFLMYALISGSGALNDQARGVAQKGIYLEALREFGISHPQLSEQRRIVTLLDEAFEGIATAKARAEQNLRNASELFAQMSAALLASAASSSAVCALEELVTSDCSLSYGIVQPGDEHPDGLPIVRPVDLNEGIVTLEGLKRIDPALASSYERTTLRGNDILLCVRGSTGTMAMADNALAGANVTRGIVPIRFDASKLSQEIGYWLMRSEPVQQQIRAKTYGTALMQINIRDLRQLQVPVPPLSAQPGLVQAFADLESHTSELAGIYQRKLTALAELKQSLLHQAFTGQL